MKDNHHITQNQTVKININNSAVIKEATKEEIISLNQFLEML